jgi:hypothetical protein
MHKMKEKVILRILAQESPTSEFRLRRYGEKKLLGHFVIFGKWLGLNWNLFLKTRGLLEIFEDYGLISHKGKGLTAKSAGIFQRRIFFQRENMVHLVHHLWTMGGAGPRWTADRASAVAHWSSF